MAKRKANKAKHVKKAKIKPDGISVPALKRAIEGRDSRALARFYATNALLRVIDRDNPPSRPNDIKGKKAIASYFNDVCGRDMTHKVEGGVTDGKRLAFTQRCAYPNGTKVFCSALLELKGGKIARQTVVQAWDG
jgi:hypothetical protein